MASGKKKHILRTILFIIGGLFLVFILMAVFAPEKYRNMEPAKTAEPVTEKPESDPYAGKYNLVFENSEGKKGAEALIENGSLVIHNVFENDLTNLYIIVDVWKDRNSDSTYVAKDIEPILKNKVLVIDNWTRIGEGKPTENESLPGEGYTIRHIEIDSDEGLFEAREIE